MRTYLRVTDIERAVERAAQLGGKIALEPVKISGHGKIAIYLYAGIEQGLWQVPSSAAGAEAPAAEPQRR